VTKAVKSSVEF